jgi:hypothetical protein
MNEPTTHPEPFGFDAQAGEPWDVTLIHGFLGSDLYEPGARFRARFKRLPSLRDPIVGYIIHGRNTPPLSVLDQER